MLVATADAFEPPQRVVIAFDGSRAARKALSGVARHPLLAGMPMDLVRAGVDTAEVRRELEAAQATLATAGIQAGAQLLIGDAQQVLPDAVKARGPALLVMGAFGHSRLRQWLLGSTTTTLLRRSDVPVLILR
jgi:nucleotide-binding universal stress UspA family protein